MLLSLPAREKWERQRGSYLFVRQCQFSDITAANTLVLLCKQATTGGKYTAAKWREERHHFKKMCLCHLYSFLTCLPSKEHHFLVTGHFFKIIVCEGMHSLGKHDMKCVKDLWMSMNRKKSIYKQETKICIFHRFLHLHHGWDQLRHITL